MTQGTSDLDTTIGALQGGLTSVNPATAVSVISNWQQQLQGSSDSTLKSIAEDLGDLKDQLTSGNLDGKAIGAVLTRLGSKTATAAASADGQVASKLQTLGKLLSGAGSSL